MEYIKISLVEHERGGYALKVHSDKPTWVKEISALQVSVTHDPKNAFRFLTVDDAIKAGDLCIGVYWM